MSEKRKPCPFCGSKDIIPAQEGTHYAECQRCGAYGPSVYWRLPMFQDYSESFLIEEGNRLWDKRA